MKMIKTAVCAFAVACALVAGKASAVSTPVQFTVLSVSGTADFVTTNYLKFTKRGTNDVGTNYISITKSTTFNNATIYSIISNAVANATSYTTNLTNSTLPANGYIAFSPDGFFYATNKTGFYLPLSGDDATNGYYSYIELDTVVPDYGTIGFADDFDYTYSTTLNVITQNGPASSTSAALLYLHDDPYSFDDADYPYEYQNNNAAIEIRGVLKVSVTIKDGNATASSASLSGTGNIILPEYENGGVVTSASAKLTK